MSDQQTRSDVETIEHLDFTPTCEATQYFTLGCENKAPATHLAVHLPCGRGYLMCAKCIAWRASIGVQTWKAHCGTVETAAWLDTVKVYALDGAA